MKKKKKSYFYSNLHVPSVEAVVGKTSPADAPKILNLNICFII